MKYQTLLKRILGIGLVFVLLPGCSALGTPSPTLPAKSTSSPMEKIWSTNGGPEIPFQLPTELALDAQGNTYVIDGGNHRVQKFDKDGNFILTWGSQGAGDGQFLFRVPPAHYGSITVDKDGYVYVTDRNNRIQKFDSSGTFLMKFGGTGYADGEFATLYGVAVDDQGNIYTADWDKHDVQKFSSEGKLLQNWEVPSCKPGGISFPHNLVVDSQGQIYIPNADGNCIQKFDNEGNLLQQWGEMGEADGQLRKPINIVLDKHGNIYVSENRNGRIQKFDPNGNFLAIYGPFDLPDGIAVDSEGYVYVIEVGSGSLKKLRLP